MMAEKKLPIVDPWGILQHPLLTEKSLSRVEAENKLVFIVRRNSSKKQIASAIEQAFEVKVDSVNTIIDRKGRKKATVKLMPEFKAADIAMRFGML